MVNWYSPGLLVNKDGSLQVTFKYRGPDLDSATIEELSSITIRLNNAINQLGSGWVFYAEAQRVISNKYDSDTFFDDPITKKIDEERSKY